MKKTSVLEGLHSEQYGYRQAAAEECRGQVGRGGATGLPGAGGHREEHGPDGLRGERGGGKRSHPAWGRV